MANKEIEDKIQEVINTTLDVAIMVVKEEKKTIERDPEFDDYQRRNNRSYLLERLQTRFEELKK